MIENRNFEQMKTFLNQNPSMLSYIVGNVGSGKSLFEALFGYYYRLIYPNRIIDTNMNVNLSKVNYNPYCFYAYNDLTPKLIIIDDTRNKELIFKAVGMSSNKRRKLNLHIILSVQRDKYVIKELRDLATYYIEVECTDLIKDKRGNNILSYESELLVHLISETYESTMIIFQDVRNIIESIKLFNTKEITKQTLDKYIIFEAFKVSKNRDDLLCNLLNYYCETKGVKYYRKILKHGFDICKNMNVNQIESLIYNIPIEYLEKCE